MTTPESEPQEQIRLEKPWRILIVDDEAGVRKVLKEFLVLDDYSVDTAASGEEAIALIEKVEYDVVITDLMLPDIDGFDLRRMISERLPNAIQILITGMPTLETLTLALREGIHDYLSKPINHRDISRAVKNAIRTKSLAERNQKLRQENERYREWLEESVRQKNEKLQLSLKQLTNLRSALDRTQILTVTDNENRIRYANSRFCQLVGIKRAKLIGRDWFGISVKAEDDLLVIEIKDAIGKGKIWEGTINGQSISKTPWWCETAVVPFYGPDGVHLQNVIIQTEITAIIESREQIKKLAYSDNMTKLPNRAKICELIQEEAQTVSDFGNFAVGMLDIDDFKSFNEAYGREIGDYALMGFVSRIQANIGSHLLARLGSDQFGILFRSPTSEKEVMALATKLQSIFSKPIEIGDDEYHITACCGIALYPEHGRTQEELLLNASIALDMAKREGRSHFSVYRDRMHLVALSRITLEADLRRALSNNEFELHYQPKIEISTGKLVGAEALLRWRKSGHGLVAPDEFIPYAEESGLIVKIGRWVMDEACRQIAVWRSEGLADCIVSVNVSARQFRHSNIITYVFSALANSGLEPASLELEITENVLMNGVESTLDTLNSLHNLGIRLSIDDFGTGYSSLSYLKDFPVQVLKIDRSFIDNIGRDERDANIARGIISLAQNLNLRVLAEGVETQSQLEFLRHEGCDEIQGFLYSPPLPSKDFFSKYGPQAG